MLLSWAATILSTYRLSSFEAPGKLSRSERELAVLVDPHEGGTMRNLKVNSAVAIDDMLLNEDGSG